MIGAVAGHESIHASDEENIRTSGYNKHIGQENDVEARPNEIETKILLESLPQAEPMESIKEIKTEKKEIDIKK